MANKNYPSGTEFEITLKVISTFLWTDEAEIVESLIWALQKTEDDITCEIVPGSVRATKI